MEKRYGGESTMKLFETWKRMRKQPRMLLEEHVLKEGLGWSDLEQLAKIIDYAVYLEKMRGNPNGQ